MNRQDLGRVGENQIAEYLIRHGWTILEMNYRYHKKEVDIIAKKYDMIVFVEVKKRSTRKFGRGFEAIDANKMNNMIYVARHYLKKHNLTNCNIRFDVASIDENAFSYIEDAFQLSGN